MIPSVIAVWFWYFWARAANYRDKAIVAVQMVEAEYRMMSQHVALFEKVEETSVEMRRLFEEKMNELA